MHNGPERRPAAGIVLIVAGLATAMSSAGVARAPAAAVARAAEQAAPQALWLDQLGTYVRAIAEHQPGSVDLPARMIESWTEKDLDAVQADLLALQSVCPRATDRGSRNVALRYRNETFDAARVATFLAQNGARAFAEAVDRLLQHGAVLHADIAMRVAPFRIDAIGCSTTASTVMVLDGHAVGAGCLNYHWKHGRALLDALSPDPASDAFATLWYHASITFLLEETNYSDANPQLARARMRFPSNARIEFEHGCYQEALAGPHVQVLPGASRSGLSRPATHLGLAEESFRRAVKIDAGLVEARVRHGAVLARLGRHHDAVAALQKALETAQEPVLRYFAELFLGRAEEGLGNRAAAQGHFERALAESPTAQTPLLALGRLARGAGDRVQAAALVRRAIEAQARAGQRGDPWWVYYIWQRRDSASLLEELYRVLARGGSS